MLNLRFLHLQGISCENWPINDAFNGGLHPVLTVSDFCLRIEYLACSILRARNKIVVGVVIVHDREVLVLYLGLDRLLQRK